MRIELIFKSLGLPCCLFSILILSSVAVARPILRVDGIAGSPTGNGSGWGSNAYLYLQDAIDEANENAGQFNLYEIWVRGKPDVTAIFKPELPTADPQVRAKSFKMHDPPGKTCAKCALAHAPAANLSFEIRRIHLWGRSLFRARTFIDDSAPHLH